MSDIIHVSGQPHPLRSDLTVENVPAGLTIAEILERVGLPKVCWPLIEVELGGCRVYSNFFHCIKPKPGMLLSYRVRMQDTGIPDSTTRLLIGTVSQFGGLAASFLIGGPVGAIVGGVIGVGGVLAANVLVPPSPMTLDQTGGHSLTGSRNRWRPYEPVTKIFGRVRTFPDLAAAPWRQVEGDKQYLSLLLVVGHGPLKLSDIQIGGTPIHQYDLVHEGVAQGGEAGIVMLDESAADQDYEYVGDLLIINPGTENEQRRAISDYVVTFGQRTAHVQAPWDAPLPGVGTEFRIERNVSRYRNVQYELIEGRPGDRTRTSLYPNQVFETDLNVNLPGPNNWQTDGWESSVTEPDIDEISVDLLFPNGLRHDTEQGAPLSVQYQIQYRPIQDELDEGQAQRGSDHWWPVIGVDSFARMSAQGMDNDRAFQLLDRFLDRLENLRDNFEIVFPAEGSNTETFPISIIRRVFNNTVGVLGRLQALRARGLYNTLLPARQQRIDDLIEILDVIGFGFLDPDLGNWVDGAYGAANAAVRDYIDSLLDFSPMFAALIEVQREIQEGRLRELSDHPVWIRFWLVSQGRHEAAGFRPPEHEGELDSVPSSTSVVLDGAASDEDDAYNEMVIVIVSGDGVGQTRRIVSYVGSTRTATLDRAFHENPASSDLFELHDATGITTETSLKSGVHRVNHTWPVDRGRYQVRIRRRNNDRTGAQFRDRLDWSVLRSLKHEDPIKGLDQLAILALKVEATDQISGALDQVSVLAESELPVWTGSEWVVQPTRNPAWAYADVLRNGRINRRPLDDEDIDLPVLAQWAADADAEEFKNFEDEVVQQGRHCDLILSNPSTVFDTLRAIAASGRASFSYRDGLYSVVRDEISPPLTQHFGARNSWGFEWDRAFFDEVHAVRVRFANAEAEYQPDEEIIYAPGYSLDGSVEDTQTATKFETVEAPGTTSRWQAHKDGRYWLNARELRPETFTFFADFEHIACRRGDRIRVTHDAPLFGLGSGRIKAVDLNGSGHVTEITLDEPVEMQDGVSYGLRIRAADGSSHVGTLVFDEGIQHTVEFVTPINPGSSATPAVGDLALWGEASQETVELLVTEIEPREDQSARIRAVPLAPELLTADLDPVPPRSPFITLPPPQNPLPPPMPVILRVETQTYRNADSILLQRIAVILTPPTVGVASHPETIEIQWSDTVLYEALIASFLELMGQPGAPTAIDIQRAFRDFLSNPDMHQGPSIDASGNVAYIFDAQEGIQYRLRVRYVAANGLASDWATAQITVDELEGPVKEAQGLIDEIRAVIPGLGEPGEVFLADDKRILFGNALTIFMRYNSSTDRFEIVSSKQIDVNNTINVGGNRINVRDLRVGSSVSLYIEAASGDRIARFQGTTGFAVYNSLVVGANDAATAPASGLRVVGQSRFNDHLSIDDTKNIEFLPASGTADGTRMARVENELHTYFQNTRAITVRATTIMNDSRANRSFVVRTVPSASTLFIRGSDGRVGINGAALDYQLDVNGNIHTNTNLKLTNNSITTDIVDGLGLCRREIANLNGPVTVEDETPGHLFSTSFFVGNSRAIFYGELTYENGTQTSNFFYVSTSSQNFSANLPNVLFPNMNWNRHVSGPPSVILNEACSNRWSTVFNSAGDRIHRVIITFPANFTPQTVWLNLHSSPQGTGWFTFKNFKLFTNGNQ